MAISNEDFWRKEIEKRERLAYEKQEREERELQLEVQKQASKGFTYTYTDMATSPLTPGQIRASTQTLRYDPRTDNWWTTPPEPHTNLGVCQESYDKGYEDGLKAALEKQKLSPPD